MRYNGPQPPDKDHDYMLEVFGTQKPLANLKEGFYLNEMMNEIRHYDSYVDVNGLYLRGKA